MTLTTPCPGHVRVCLFASILAVAGLSSAPNARGQHDGGLDARFNVGAGASDDVFSAAVYPSGGTLLGGYFTTFDGQERWRLARLGKEGALDPGFDPGDSSGSAPITQVAVLADGSALAAGSFGRFGGLPRPLVVRLKPDGKVDGRFNTSAAFGGVQGRVQALAALPDGALLVGGRFDPSAAARRASPGVFLVRLGPDGERDDTFRCEPVPHDREDLLSALAVLPGGKVLIGTHTGLTRLEATGARDAGFHPAAADLPGAVTALAVQRDGKILAAAMGPGGEGWRIARLGADGQADAAFHPVEQAAGDEAGAVKTLVVQSDGKILVGGSFRMVGGIRRHGLARLEADGTLDRAFDPGTGVETLPADEADETPEAAVDVLLPLPDHGGLLVAGRFDLYNGTVCHNVVRVFNGVVPAAAVPVAVAATPALPSSEKK